MKRLRMAQLRTNSRDCRSERRPRLVVDCSLDHHMTNERELTSLASQIYRVYCANQSAPRPFQFYLTGLVTGTRTHTAILNNDRDFLNKKMMEVTDLTYDRLFDAKNIIYLSPDSTHELLQVEESKVYVLGGIVDLCINKNLTRHRARMAGIRTACLPVDRFMVSDDKTLCNLNLPINIVTRMLLDCYNGIEWPQILTKHLPKRKGFKLKPEYQSTLQPLS